MRPIRSEAGSRAAVTANGSGGNGAHEASPGSGPARMSSSSAVSRTVRVRTPSCRRKLSPASGASEMRPREGFRPTRPQQAAGIRSEPPPSLPCASGTMPAATAAADPPDEPPGVRSRSHGLRAGPQRRGSVTGRIPHSGSVVVPTMTKPASRSRRTTLWSCGATKSAMRSAQRVRRRPSTGRLFLIAIGTPANGRSSPGSIAAATARAPSRSTSTNAFSVGSSSSTRRREASTSSSAEISPSRTSAARSVTGRCIRSASLATLNARRSQGAARGLIAEPTASVRPTT